MAQARKIIVNGEEMNVVDVEFKIKNEDWQEYDLLDGGRVRVKLTVNRILQVLDSDGRPARTADGERLLVIQSANQVVVLE